ncbi:NAD(P)H-binding protein [Raineyella sp. LH-20]|uniref:NAD(P)H-binding protein n=1 Tax=Raineyella sp. LH-20 TaxID=3081204 RepID=UPI0029544C48|nr:NAD(P)H-binding protein [Raineyella sp. LH-20]WOP17585.1 NAD(P)H-binding protein [Raineyella sp. LH-20]
MRIAVIGATGQIGARVIETAHHDGHEVVGISRRPPTAPPVDWRAVDAADPDQLATALRGADVVVATLGLHYDIATWTAQWSPLTRSVIAAVRAAEVPMVWLDNCYPYGETTAPITEETAFAPCSRMGRVRAEVADILTTAVADGTPITVARAADFLGPGVETTLLRWSTLEKAGRAGDRRTRLAWIGDPDTTHSYASADEVARSLVALATCEERTSQPTWLLPALEPVTGREICGMLAQRSGHEVVPAVLPPAVLTVAGWVSPLVRASNDMAYLSDRDFLVDDVRFRTAFGWGPAGTVADLLDRELSAQPAN